MNTPRFYKSFETCNWLWAGFSMAKATTACSTEASTRFFGKASCG